MSRLIVCRGIPGSGKSYWANEYVKQHPDTKIVNRDTLRLLHPGLGEAAIRTMRDALIDEYLSDGYTVISDDTNLIPKTYDRLVTLGRSHGAEIITQTFYDVDIAECIRRDAARPNPVGAKVVKSFVKFLNEAKNTRQPIVNVNTPLPKAVISDLDGTLALFNGRGAFEIAKCETDDVSVPVATVLEAMKDRGCTIILMSGREDKFRPHTERWLSANHIYYDQLLMRATNDFRKDSVIKRELYEAHIKNKYTVLFVLDDRDQVVDFWRKEVGMVVFQVADGDF
jgi:predicted kinase